MAIEKISSEPCPACLNCLVALDCRGLPRFIIRQKHNALAPLEFNFFAGWALPHWKTSPCFNSKTIHTKTELMAGRPVVRSYPSESQNRERESCHFRHGNIAKRKRGLEKADCSRYWTVFFKIAQRERSVYSTCAIFKWSGTISYCARAKEGLQLAKTEAQVTYN